MTIEPNKESKNMREVKIVRDSSLCVRPRYTENILLLSGLAFFSLIAYASGLLNPGISVRQTWLGSRVNWLTFLQSIALLIAIGIVQAVLYLILYCNAGARPRLKLLRHNIIITGFAVSGCGKLLFRSRYLTILAAPPILTALTGIWLIFSYPHIRIAFIVSLSYHVAYCHRILETIRNVLKVPRSAMVEDTEEGFRYIVSNAL